MHRKFVEMENQDVTDDYNMWVPPSDDQLKIMQIRRERADKISQIMGRYLLAGHKMLDSVCDKCSTILLEDRKKKTYCIACSEVDVQPVAEGNIIEKHPAAAMDTSTNVALKSWPRQVDDSAVAERTVSDTKRDTSWSTLSQDNLKHKIQTVSDEIVKSQSVSDCIQYCSLIKACVEALSLLQTLDK